MSQQEYRGDLLLAPDGHGTPPAWEVLPSQILTTSEMYWSPPARIKYERPAQDEAASWARAMRERDADVTPVHPPQYPVGSWAANCIGQLSQLRSFNLQEPDQLALLLFPEGAPNLKRVGLWGYADPLFEGVVAKYQDWIERGFYPCPPALAVETRNWRVCINEGHHRAAATYRAGKTDYLVWVAATGLFWDERYEMYCARGVTHRQYIEYALLHGSIVPEAVLKEYTDLGMK